MSLRSYWSLIFTAVKSITHKRRLFDDVWMLPDLQLDLKMTWSLNRPVQIINILLILLSRASLVSQNQTGLPTPFSAMNDRNGI